MDLKALQKASKKLSSFYKERTGEGLPPISSSAQREAYLAVRFPATYAVLRKVLQELQKRADLSSCASLLDVGAGPGTATKAALDAGFPIQKQCLIERDPGFIALGKERGILGEWICQDVSKIETFPKADLVIASYVLNELPNKKKVVEKLWESTQSYLVIVEPGTPKDFEKMKEIRGALIEKGATLLAPCPHEQPCPLPSSDWCHFGARLERSSLHQKIKGADLNYEDEKYFYIIFSKQGGRRCGARVLKRVVKGKGFVKIQFCSTGGIELKTGTKKNKEQYLFFKGLEWGEGVEE